MFPSNHNGKKYLKGTYWEHILYYGVLYFELVRYGCGIKFLTVWTFISLSVSINMYHHANTSVESQARKPSYWNNISISSVFVLTLKITIHTCLRYWAQKRDVVALLTECFPAIRTRESLSIKQDKWVELGSLGNGLFGNHKQPALLYCQHLDCTDILSRCQECSFFFPSSRIGLFPYWQGRNRTGQKHNWASCHNDQAHIYFIC